MRLDAIGHRLHQIVERRDKPLLVEFKTFVAFARSTDGLEKIGQGIGSGGSVEFGLTIRAGGNDHVREIDVQFLTDGGVANPVVWRRTGLSGCGLRP